MTAIPCVRTPDECFRNLPGFPYKAQYITLSDGIRVGYVDEGPRNAPPVLLMHGEPSWSYLYRKMIPHLVKAGHRVVAPDLVGMGRSDKPVRQSDYTYARHVAWMEGWLLALGLTDITLFCQDWGGLIGLRLVAAHPHRFARVVVANTFLPTGHGRPSDAFLKWRAFSQKVPVFPTGVIIQGATTTDLPDDVVAAYDAPFPTEEYKAGIRIFPTLVPISPNDPESVPNEKAWDVLRSFKKPFLTAFSDSDPITKGLDATFQSQVPGCAGQEHVTVKNGGHFLQEDCGEELATIVNNFVRSVQSKL